MAVDEQQTRSRSPLPIAIVAGVALVTLAIVYVRRKLTTGSHVALGLTIDRPVEEVFPFVADARNALRWLPVAVERTKLTEGPVGLGTRFEGTDRIGGRIVAHSQEIIAFEPAARVTTRISGPGSADYDIRFEPVDGATRLTIDVRGRSSGPYRLLDLVPDTLMTRGYEQAYMRLKDLLERGGAELASIPIETETEAIAATTEAGTPD